MNQQVKSRVPNRIFDYTTGPDSPYYGKWVGELYGKEVSHVNVECQFEHNMDGNVVVLFDTRFGHAGYLGVLWTTDEFENEGLYLYVAETESRQAQAFEYYQDAIKWLQTQH